MENRQWRLHARPKGMVQASDFEKVPIRRSTLSAMLSAPLAVQVPPPAPTQVQVAPVSAAGSVSVTVAPVTAAGPLLPATIAYVIVWPG